jgi:hypothetical protein
MKDEVFLDICRAGYRAVLDMIGQAVDLCPEGLWDARKDEPPFWQQAYHALMYTDFYLGVAPREYRKPAFAEEKANDLAFVPTVTPSRAELATYAGQIRAKAEAAVAALTAEKLEAKNAFGWTGPTVAHRHVYNVRHAQHHAGRLNSLLARRGGAAAKWVMFAEWSGPAGTGRS